MPDAIRILRLQRTDQKDDYLLLQVAQTSATRPLDLKLVATDQEHIYHGSIKSSQLGKIRSEHFAGDEDELRDVLLFSFMRDRPDGADATILAGVEMVAAIQKETATLTLRKNIGGITQRIAAVALAQDDEKEEVSAFDWVDQAVAISDELRDELSTMQQSISIQQDEITKLKARLEDFIKAKKEHDEDLLIKFAALLNTKKQRIRDLTYGTPEGKDEDAMDEDKSQHKRGPKRKADADGDEEMEAAEEQERHDETPEQTETSDDEHEEPIHNTRSTASQQSPYKSVSDLPPPIELPFGKKAKESPQPQPPIDEDETDDEL